MKLKWIKLTLGFVLLIHNLAWSAQAPNVEQKDGQIDVAMNCQNPHPTIQKICTQERELEKLRSAIDLLQEGQYGVILVTFGSLPFMILQKIAKKSAGTLAQNVSEVLSSTHATAGQKRFIRELLSRNVNQVKKQNLINNIVLGTSAISFLVMGHYKDSLRQEFLRQSELHKIQLMQLKLEVLKSLKDGTLDEKFGPSQEKKSGEDSGKKTTENNEDFI